MGAAQMSSRWSYLKTLACSIRDLIVSLYPDSGGKTANTSSDTLDSSMDEKSLMHLKLSPSETHPPVLKEDPVLFDDQPESAASLCIAVI
ncbi:hypothetical protein GUJ93_ZPchr0002g25109 [Zizania palustris]|uniref:Uncharacterized protein n=1 Tax=Zizania palustris TaxID=103762 RepID=A0A8J5SQF0_ZIZPA|nr:hypothetical protein GUJ93_ZPchr0002g25109 [Zizania palustris]